MKNITIKFLLILLFSFLIGIKLYSQFDGKYEAAVQLIKEKNYKEANILLSEIYLNFENNFNIVSNYAKTFYELEDYENAELYYNKAIRLNHDCSECFAFLSKIYIEKDISKANDYLNRAKEINSELPLNFYVTALILRKNKNFESAITNFNRAVYLEPDNPDYLYERACTFLTKQEYESAINDLKKILTIESNFSIVEFYLAYSYMMISDFKNSLLYINSAIKNDSTKADYYNLQFTILFQLKDYYNAETSLFNSLTINPNDYNVYINLGDMYFQLGEYEAFCDSYGKAINLMSAEDKQKLTDIEIKYEKYCNEKLASYYYVRSQSCFLNKEYNEAIIFADKGLKINEQSPILHDIKSSALLSLQNIEAAEKEIYLSISLKNNLSSDIKKFFLVDLSPNELKSTEKSYFAKFYLQLASVQTIKKEYEKSLNTTKIALDIANTEKTFAGIEYFYILNTINYIASNKMDLAAIEINTAYKKNSKNPICTLFTAYYTLFSACDFSTTDLNFEYIEDLKVPRIILPKLTLNQTNKSKLQEVVMLCDNLIKNFPYNPFPYLIKSKSNLLLELSDYCEFAKKSKELGLKNVFKELQINCD